MWIVKEHRLFNNDGEPLYMTSAIWATLGEIDKAYLNGAGFAEAMPAFKLNSYHFIKADSTFFWLWLWGRSWGWLWLWLRLWPWLWGRSWLRLWLWPRYFLFDCVEVFSEDLCYFFTEAEIIKALTCLVDLVRMVESHKFLNRPQPTKCRCNVSLLWILVSTPFSNFTKLHLTQRISMDVIKSFPDIHSLDPGKIWGGIQKTFSI